MCNELLSNYINILKQLFISFSLCLNPLFSNSNYITLLQSPPVEQNYESTYNSALKYLSDNYPNLSYETVSFDYHTENPDSVMDKMVIKTISGKNYSLRHYYKNPSEWWEDTVYFNQFSQEYENKVNEILKSNIINSVNFAMTDYHTSKGKLKTPNLNKFLQKTKLAENIKDEIYIEEKNYNSNLNFNQVKEDLIKEGFKGEFLVYIIPNDFNFIQENENLKNIRRKLCRISLSTNSVCFYDEAIMKPFENNPKLKFDDNFVEIPRLENFDVKYTANTIDFYSFFPSSDSLKVRYRNSYILISNNEEMKILETLKHCYEVRNLIENNWEINGRKVRGVLYNTLNDDESVNTDVNIIEIYQNIGEKYYLEISIEDKEKTLDLDSALERFCLK